MIALERPAMDNFKTEPSGPVPASFQVNDMEKTAWKQKLRREVIEYWVVFTYLAVFFGSFTLYRKLILAEHQISSFHFGMSLVEALILAKVILIGDALRLGRRFEERPLIFPTLYKALAFSLFVVVFAVLEHTLNGMIHGKGLTAGLQELISQGQDELLARCLIMFTAFIPFFAFQQLGKTLGEGTIRELFFTRKKGSPTNKMD
jgi:hypothetical protein